MKASLYHCEDYTLFIAFLECSGIMGVSSSGTNGYGKIGRSHSVTELNTLLSFEVNHVL